MKEYTILSWPQSGRTWLITMIGKAIYDYEGECDLATKFSPYGFGKDINNLGSYNLHTFPREHEDQAWLKKPQELKHDKTYLYDMYGKENTIPAEDVNVIFIVRDPIDTLVSNYNRRTKIKNPRTRFDGTLSEFLHSEKGSIQTMILWLNIWAHQFDKLNSYIIVRYEDLHEKGEKELDRVLKFIGYKDIPKSIIESTVEFAEFENMKKIEQSEGNKNHTMFSKEHHFLREGKPNSGLSKLEEKDQYTALYYRNMLDPIYGYKKIDLG